MTTVAAPRRYLPDFDLKTPDWADRIPGWVTAGGVIVFMIALSTFLRSRYLNGQFWMSCITTARRRFTT